MSASNVIHTKWRTVLRKLGMDPPFTNAQYFLIGKNWQPCLRKLIDIPNYFVMTHEYDFL